MQPRERVRLALHHHEPDRVPMDLGGTGVSTIHIESYRRLLDRLGIIEEPVLRSNVSQTVEVSEAVRQRLGVDFICLRPYGIDEGAAGRLGRTFTDEWGITYQTSEDLGGRYFSRENPLARASLAEIKAYPLPDLADPRRIAGLRERAATLYRDTGYALVADGMPNIIQRAFDLRGMAEFMMDLASGAGEADALLDRLTESYLTGLSPFLDAVGEYVEVVTVADDLGTQTGPMLAPAMYRKHLKPCHRALVAEIRRHTDAPVFFHSDGAIRAFVPDLIDAGFSIINPVQASARGMDLRRLKAEFGHDLCFWGSVDTQHVLPEGTPGEVANEVRRRVEELASGGGLVLGAVHIIQYDVPPENILALYGAGLEYGRYAASERRGD